MATRTHVWLLNMGGPDSPLAVRPFLQRLLGDPLVIPLPFLWLQAVFAWLIAWKRAREVIPAYERMGGQSPQLAMVGEQASRLNRCLGPRYACAPVLRYWGPSADAAASSLADGDQVVLLSLYPHACGATTTTSLEDARRALATKRVQVAEVESYPTDPAYVEAVAETLREAILRLPRRRPYEVLFSAHGLPLSRVEAGDPYLREIEATVAAVVGACRLAAPHRLCFQSRVGVQKWLSPSTADQLRDCAARGVRAVVVVPIAFTSEHIETRIELDEELRELSHNLGIELFERAATVGARPTFVHALAELVRRAERGAGWAVPEDELRLAVAEALRAEAEAEAKDAPAPAEGAEP